MSEPVRHSNERARATGHRPRSRRPILLASAMVVAGGVLVALAAPRLDGGLSLVRTAPAMHAIDGDPGLDRAALEELAARLEEASESIDDGRVQTDLGYVLRELARDSGYDTAEGQTELGRAASHIRMGLAQSPVDPYAWLRLARVLDATDAAPRDILGALRMSVLTGPYVPKLFEGRLELALRYWDDHDEDTRVLIERQIRLAWSRIPVVIVQRSMRYERMPEVAEALDSLPGALEEYRARLRRWLAVRPIGSEP
jgi:hypothetical protein